MRPPPYEFDNGAKTKSSPDTHHAITCHAVHIHQRAANQSKLGDSLLKDLFSAQTSSMGDCNARARTVRIFCDSADSRVTAAERPLHIAALFL
jgi:hypothetical protein